MPNQEKNQTKQTKWSFYTSLMRSFKEVGLSEKREARGKIAKATLTSDELFTAKLTLKTITGGVK